MDPPRASLRLRALADAPPQIRAPPIKIEYETVAVPRARRDPAAIEPKAESQASVQEAAPAAKKKRRVSAPAAKQDFVPPADWEETYALIAEMRKQRWAPVDGMATEMPDSGAYDEKACRLHTLISLILSSQTKDTVNMVVMARLKQWGLTVQGLLDVPNDELNRMIHEVGFHNRKTIYIKETAKVLREKYDDDIPPTLEALLELPGVGPKMAYIAMSCAWKQNVGIGVDTHVHRISTRLRWVPAGTQERGPEATRAALEAWLPREYWGAINKMLVGLGQTICVPVGPKCGECLLQRSCPSSTMK